MKIRTHLAVGLGGAGLCILLLSAVAVAGLFRMRVLTQMVKKTSDPMVRTLRIEQANRAGLLFLVTASGLAVVSLGLGGGYFGLRFLPLMRDLSWVEHASQEGAEGLDEEEKARRTERWDELFRLWKVSTQGVADRTGPVQEALDASQEASDQTQSLAASTEEVRMATEHLGSLVQQSSVRLKDHVEALSQTLREVEHMEEFGEKLQEVAENARKESERQQLLLERSKEEIQQTAEALDQMNERLAPLDSLVQSLGGRSKDIDNVGQFITNISSQTDVLALNATIEAVKAGGEAGRGFTVVAQRIRRLAIESTEAGDKIRAEVELVRAEIAEVMERVRQIAAVLEDGRKWVREGLEESDGIKDSMHAIFQISSEVLRCKGQLVSQIESVVGELRKLLDGLNETLLTAANAENMSEQQTEATLEASRLSRELSVFLDALHTAAVAGKKTGADLEVDGAEEDHPPNPSRRKDDIDDAVPV